jgi:hypothetical protein
MANPTTAFGWVMPNSADLVTDLPADFAVFGQGVDTSMQYLLGGTTGQVLSKTSATNMAFTWIANDQGDLTAITAGTGISVTSPTGPIPTVAIDATVATLTGSQTLTNKTLTSPALTTPTISTATTNGDILYGTGSGALARLGIGSSAQVLTVASGVPSWATPAGGGGGKVLQVVNSTHSTNVTSASGSYADTGLTATITPTLNTSKILVLVNQAGCGKQSSDTALQLQLLRGATVLAKIEGIGGYTGTAAQNFIGSVSSSFLDSPATTSATTYKTQLASFSASGDSCVQQQSSVSTITLLEIGV